jgi:hypothetical protein
MIAAVLLALALGSAGQAPAEVVTQIQVHGNMLTPEDEVVRLAEVSVGMPFESSTLESVTARLRATRRFVSIEVLKRYASITDPSQIILESHKVHERHSRPHQAVRALEEMRGACIHSASHHRFLREARRRAASARRLRRDGGRDGCKAMR